MHIVGLSKLALGKDDQAVTWYRRSIELNRNYFLSHCFLAAALVGIGQPEEAGTSIKVALELNLVVLIARLRRVIRTATDAPAVLAYAERVSDNLRKIGMPAGSQPTSTLLRPHYQPLVSAARLRFCLPIWLISTRFLSVWVERAPTRSSSAEARRWP